MATAAARIIRSAFSQRRVKRIDRDEGEEGGTRAARGGERDERERKGDGKARRRKAIASAFANLCRLYVVNEPDMLYAYTRALRDAEQSVREETECPVLYRDENIGSCAFVDRKEQPYLSPLYIRYITK